MAFQTLNNGESMSSARNKINNNFSNAVEFSDTETAGQFNRLSNPTWTAIDRLNYAGYFYAKQIHGAVYNESMDLAECCKRGSPSEEGDIIGIDIKSGFYRKAQKGDLVIGVESHSYGVLLGAPDKEKDEWINEYIPVGFTGRIPVKVKGKVKIGQYINLWKDGIGKPSYFKTKNTVGIAIENSMGGTVQIKIV